MHKMLVMHNKLADGTFFLRRQKMVCLGFEKGAALLGLRKILPPRVLED